MKKIFIMCMLLLTTLSLISCSKKDKSGQGDPVLLYNKEDFIKYFNVKYSVSYTDQTAYVDVIVSPKKQITLEPNCYCTVWVIVDISMRVNTQIVTYTFYEDVLINLSTNGYGTGTKKDYRGQTITKVLRKGYDVKGLYVIVYE